MHNKSLKIVRLDDISFVYVLRFFEDIKNNKWFHPHPFTEKVIWELDNKQDLYYVLADFSKPVSLKDKVLAYGFIRGWDAEWEDKCLGICVHPDHRNKGYGELMVRFLHVAARERGLEKIRLHVHPDNTKALSLYKKMGYEIVGTRKNGELIGYKKLGKK